MKEIPQQVSESVKRRNPHLYTSVTGVAPTGETVTISIKPPKRIRQSSKPLMNKLEQRCFDHLCKTQRPLHAQAVTFRLANGVRYTPDIISFDYPWRNVDHCTVAWEVKGPWFTDDAIVKLKVFAAAYPNILVLLAFEDEPTGIWLFQEVFA